MLAEARVALQRDAPGDAIRALRAALEVARGAELPEFEAEVDDLLATAYRRIGRFEEALDARERHAARARELGDRSTAMRLEALRREHEVAEARQRSEIFRLRDDRRADRGDDGPQVDHAAAVQLDAFERLAVLAEFRDVDTGEHTRRVGDMAAEIAHAAGQLPEWCERLRLAGRLHDIGKVAVPDAVLLKSGPLTVDEFEVMKTHTTVGHQILVGSSSPLFQLAAELALTHHEWWDGNGYPHGRSGRDIPLSGRIVALADVFDALCSERPYKRAWSMSEAARFVVSGGGGQFDPDLVESFVAVLLARHPELAPALA
ncbi:MAG: HD domain-containing phosphohydrolase, partial [Ilumatobacteraceae bacterium]